MIANKRCIGGSSSNDIAISDKALQVLFLADQNSITSTMLSDSYQRQRLDFQLFYWVGARKLMIEHRRI